MFDLYQQIFFTTLAFAFGILHLALFAYNRQFKSNLYFTVFLFLYAISIFFDFQRLLTPHGEYNDLFLRIHHAVMPYRSIFGLLFIYSVFQLKPSLSFWIITGGLIVSGLIATLDFAYFNLFLLWIFAYMVDALRVLTAAVRQHKNGARILSAGFLLLFILSFYDLALDFKLFPPLYNLTNGYQFGFGFLIISASVFLASDMAKMNRTILEKERQSKEDEIKRRLLEETDARKSQELQEAKNLQLAMLPRCISGLNHLDICFDMKTATEVGGDYYDYLSAEDGALIVTLGDATGHGMKAGIMVSIIKSMFVTQAAKMDFPAFFNMCSQTIRKMNLGHLYMTMLLLKIENKKLILSMAGMPPVLIFNRADGRMRELVVKGVPLGAVESFPYQTTATELKAQDVILLMSDGLPELFNDKNEMLDYPRITEAFKAAAGKPATEIAQHLFALADSWRKDRPQNDDITIVVIKVKAD
jgi:serine phosphatase RsbU (regulator of sigma subunit)